MHFWTATPHFNLGDLPALLPNQVGGIECFRRLFFGEIELIGSKGHRDILLTGGGMLTLVSDLRCEY